MTTELSAFMTENALFTVRQAPGLDLHELTSRWGVEQDLRKYGVGFLLYGLLDQVVKTNFDAVQSLDTEIEVLEDLLFGPNLKDQPLQHSQLPTP